MMQSWLLSMVTRVGVFVETSSTVAAVDKGLLELSVVEGVLELFEHPTIDAAIKATAVMTYSLRIKFEDA
jgi:hypothetical protein